MYQLPKLPFPYDALEPYIDEATMRIHHSKHHQAYVDNLNKALQDQPDLQKLSLQELLQEVGKAIEGKESLIKKDILEAVRNNGGGHANHDFFWQILSAKTQDPASEAPNLFKAIEAEFGSFSGFRDKLIEAGLKRFGSGWAWLVIDKRKRLKIYSTPNQDSPLLWQDQPILGVDVWEHAYYLKYQNRRGEYLAAWFDNLINWSLTEKLFLQV